MICTWLDLGTLHNNNVGSKLNIDDITFLSFRALDIAQPLCLTWMRWRRTLPRSKTNWYWRMSIIQLKVSQHTSLLPVPRRKILRVFWWTKQVNLYIACHARTCYIADFQEGFINNLSVMQFSHLVSGSSSSQDNQHTSRAENGLESNSATLHSVSFRPNRTFLRLTWWVCVCGLI